MSITRSVLKVSRTVSYNTLTACSTYVVSVRTVVDVFWDEMNRREKWDREHERKLKTLMSRDYDYTGKKKALDSQRESENQNRLLRDTEHAGHGKRDDH